MNQRWVGAEASWHHLEIVGFHFLDLLWTGHQSPPLKSVHMAHVPTATTNCSDEGYYMVIRLQVSFGCSVHEIRSFLEYTNLAVEYSAMAEEVDPIGSISSHCVRFCTRRLEPSHS